MGKIEKLLKSSETAKLPAGKPYALPVNKMFYLLQTVVAWGASVVLLFSALGSMGSQATGIAGNMPIYYFALMGVMIVYGLLALRCAFSGKVTFDDERITMPAFYPFMKEKLAWEDVNRAELTGVITYRNYLSLIIQKIFSSIFMNVELHVTYRNVPGGGKGNFPVLDRVGDKTAALRIIREKLGERFTVYEGEY